MSEAQSLVVATRYDESDHLPSLVKQGPRIAIDASHLFHGRLGPTFAINTHGQLCNKNASAALLLDDAQCWQLLQQSSHDVLVNHQAIEMELITSGEPKRCFSARAFPVQLGLDDMLVLWTAVETSLKDHLISALKDSRALFKDLAEAAGDFCIEIDTNGCFGYVSPAGALGYEPWALNDQPITLWGTAATAMVSEKRVGPIDLWLTDRAGEQRCITVVTAPIMRAEQWFGSRIIARDVTSERHATAALERSNRREGLQLAVLAAARDQFDGKLMIKDALQKICDHFAADACELTGTGNGVRVGKEQEATALSKNAPTACVMSTECRANGEQFGLLRLWRYDAAWTEDESQELDTVADTIALVAAQAEHLIGLNRLSLTDMLTGLANRRAFSGEMQRHLAKLVRHGGNGTLLAIDVDHFKVLNDTLGHHAGDQALMAVGALLRDTVRDTDLPARVGGDEFVVWLDNTTTVGAERVAKALQKGIKKIRDGFGHADVPLSLSIGMASWEAPVGDLQILLKRADEALYEAKRSGRGCLKIFGAR